MTEVIMPKMGDGMEEGTLVSWTKQEGDEVKEGETIGEIQTDKATLELESPGSGTLKGILIGEGDTVPVGEPIAAILADGEELPSDWGSGEPEPTTQQGEIEAAKEGGGSQAPTSKPRETGSSEAKSESQGGRVKASPLARRIAKETGVNLENVRGTGPGGRIVEKDVRDAVGTQGAPMPSKTAVSTGPAPKVEATAEDKRIELNRLRGIIAERTQKSKQQAPHFYVTVEVDVERINALREMFKDEESGKVSLNDFVVRACVLALKEMPIVNSTFQGDHILQHGAINIGIAASVDEGLLVPVMHHADHLTLRQISEASRELVKKARDGKLSPEEMQGSTFSISNMGMLNVDAFSAIINQPNSAIVAIASARRKPVAVGDQVEIRWRMNITGSFDHRTVDGAAGADFMNLVKRYLEQPTFLLS
ncbi:MAG: dihydrolipoamide acetyltransferase family protein [Fimbriimonadaceae bacterium]